MKSTLKLLALLIVFALFNCKNETANLKYQFGDMPDALECAGSSAKLYQEALYTFEKDILEFYGKNPRSPQAIPNLTNAYAQFIRNAVYSKVPYEEIVSKHTLDVFNALKSDDNLWDAENTKSHLNYRSNIINCVADNIKNQNLKTTFNALLSINDLSPKLIGAPLSNQYRNAVSDKYLAAYIALDLYYSRLFDVDISKINFDKPKPETKVDFNKVPQ